MKFIRGQFGRIPYWFYETDHVSFCVDLASWGLGFKLGRSWEVRLLCFSVFAI